MIDILIIGFDFSFLLVDDDDIFLNCLVCVMEKCGFQVLCVVIVVEVCDIVVVKFLVFVVVDLWLEDGNGLDVVDVLCEVCEDVCIIVLIGYGVIVIVVVVVKMGVLDYLLKFVDVDEVMCVLFLNVESLLLLLDMFMFVDCVCWEYIQCVYE